MNPGKILSLDDFEEAARRYLPKPVFAYVNGGVEEQPRAQRSATAPSQGEAFIVRAG